MTDEIKIPAGFRPVKFGWTDDESYDGYTDDTTWNGFDNIWVTPEVHQHIIDQNRADRPQRTNDELDNLVAGWKSATAAKMDSDTLDQFIDRIYEIDALVTVELDGDTGLYSYAYGYATIIDEDESPAPDVEFVVTVACTDEDTAKKLANHVECLSGTGAYTSVKRVHVTEQGALAELLKREDDRLAGKKRD